MKMTKLLLLAVVLVTFAMPSASWAAFDPVYGIDPDSIAWTNYEEVSLDGATYAYHVWYDDGATRIDYYAAYYDTYVNEYLLYDGTTQDQTLGWTSAYDNTWTSSRELISTDDVYLDYSEYNDGSYYYYDLDYEDYANDYYYQEGLEVLPSGSYDYYYDYWTQNLQWNYDTWYDTSDGTTGLYSYYFDPVNGTEYGYEEWSSTLTSSYSLYDWDRSGTWNWTESSYWDFDESANGSYSNYYENFSADYSAFASSYEQRTYSAEGQTTWSQWDQRTTDTSYYMTGYQWDDQVNGDYQSYAESFMPSGGWNRIGVDNNGQLYGGNGGDSLSIYFQQSHSGADYSSNYYYYYEEYVGGSLYTYDQWQYNGGYSESYYHQRSYDPGNNGDSYEYYQYNWSVDTARYYAYSYNESADNGYAYSYSETYARDWTGTEGNYEYYGSGYWESQQSSFDPYTQETSFYYNYETYAADLYAYQNSYSSVYDYYYSETFLADSDQLNVSWYLYNRDATTGSTLNYQGYYYNLDSDTRNSYWSYSYQDYAPTNDTYYYEDHWMNLATGAYDDYASYNVSGISNQWTETGSDLDYYWSNGGGWDNVAGYSYSSDYALRLANGNAHYESSYTDYATGNEFNLNLNYLDAHWTGNGILYYYDSGAYDLFLYTNYPFDYFLVQDWDRP